MAGIRSAAICAGVAIAALAFGACSSDSGKTVDVALGDYTVKPADASVAAGDVTFKVRNNGAFVHELVVVKVDDASDLPTDANGEVKEADLPEGAGIGEVEDVQPDSTKSFKLKLEAGKYVLFCNKVDGKTVHFKEGMHAGFTVTD